MNYNILVLLANNVEEIELVTPVDLWRRAGYTVTIASIDNELTVKGQQGITISADTSLAKINTSEFDSIFIPGGAGYQLIKDSSLAMNTIKYFIDNDKTVLAICAAPTILSPWLQDKKATCYPSMKALIPNWVDQAIVEDKPFITSQGAGTAHQLAFYVIKKISGDSVAHDQIKSTIF